MIRFRGVLLVLAVCSFIPAQAEPSQTAVVSKPVPAPAEVKPAAAVPPPLPNALEKADLEAFFDGIVPLQLERSDAAGATVLVRKDGKELLKKGYGFSDISKKKPVDPDSTIFRLASISKLFTWVSVMQLVEQGKLDLDTDVNQYLDFQIAPAFGKPITLRNLMTHTAGFEEEIRDILLTDPKKATPLREFLIANQPRRMFLPGEVPAYSNFGVGLGGYIVERASGQAFEDYVAAHIFQPLAMKRSSFRQPLAENLTLLPSEGYRSSTEKPVVGFEIFSPAPAGGVSSTASDMGRFAEALLNGGELDGRRILKPETLQAMWTKQFGASDALPVMCMGFYQTWRNGLRFIGHDGDLIAFHSMFLVEPKEKLVIFISYNSAGAASKTRTEIVTAFADRYYPSARAPEFQKVAAEDVKAIEGTYQSTRRAKSTKLSLGNLVSQGDAKVDKDGVLKVDEFKDLRGHVRKWKPIGKDLWQDESDQRWMFAIRDRAGKIVRIAVNFPGVQFERVVWYENSSMIFPVLGVSLAILVFVIVASLARMGRRIIMPKRPAFKPQPGTLGLTLAPRLSAIAWIVLAIGTAVLMSRLENESMLPSHDVDKYFVMMNLVTGLAIFFSVLAIVACLRVWRRSEIRFISKLKFSLVAFACLFLTWFSLHWRLIGSAHRF
jgi:CubicO group peptidase (beta-lactamase class C family)